MELSQEVKKMLTVMGFDNTETLPTMMNLRKTFIKLAVEKHPDKGGNEDDFKELYQAYEFLGNLISNSDAEEENIEEAEAKKRFREETWEEVNSSSITIKVNSNEGDAWEETLRENFGPSTKNSKVESQNNGEKFTTNFKHGGENCKIYITFYKPNKRFRKYKLFLYKQKKTNSHLI